MEQQAGTYSQKNLNKQISNMIHLNLSSPCLSRVLLATFVPAMTCGCFGEMHVESNGHKDLQKKTTLHFSNSCTTSKGSIIDIFVFEDDKMKKLDSYQRTENFNSDTAYATSTGGDKIFFICSDGQKNQYDWTWISSYSSLEKITVDLEKETLEKHTQTGECRMRAGGNDGKITLKPIVSEIILERLSCDFKGTTYENSIITDVRIYLTNVNASYSLLSDSPSSSKRFINTGMLNSNDVQNFSDPEIIVKYISDRLDATELYPHARLLCYPNIYHSESPGSPPTRLVIEGKIDSLTYYWPITINNGTGIERNCRYLYDIVIKRKGVGDPDLPIDINDIDIVLNIKPWKEVEEYGVLF